MGLHARGILVGPVMNAVIADRYRAFVVATDMLLWVQAMLSLVRVGEVGYAMSTYGK